MVEQSAPGPIKKRRRSSDGKEDHRAEGLGQSLPQSWIEQVRTALGSWYEESQRDLPWRNRDDPYAILVSEMMLVQTTVSAVIPYFERFLSQFPDPQTLANAPETEVLKAWEGLGYYRRARQLQAAARMIVERHQGQLPRDASAVRALPGVGRYMAGAILSFAFDLPEPIVEANTQRVLARLFAWPEDLKTRKSQLWLWEMAGRLVPRQGAGKFNQALMDLGAPHLHTAHSRLHGLSPVGMLRSTTSRTPGCPTRAFSETSSACGCRGLCPGSAKRGGARGSARGGGALVEILGVSDREPGGCRSRGTIIWTSGRSR